LFRWTGCDSTTETFSGEGKPTLLFLHGLTGNAHCFDHVAPDFVNTHQVLALDFRGHGDSEWHSD
jgi:pimeloyl-ACP methyl ester carboxylesterase